MAFAVREPIRIELDPKPRQREDRRKRERLTEEMRRFKELADKALTRRNRQLLAEERKRERLVEAREAFAPKSLGLLEEQRRAFQGVTPKEARLEEGGRRGQEFRRAIERGADPEKLRRIGKVLEEEGVTNEEFGAAVSGRSTLLARDRLEAVRNAVRRLTAPPSLAQMEQILKSDMPQEKKMEYWESYRQAALARQQRAPALGAVEIPFHFAGRGAEKGLEAAGAPPEAQLAGNIAAQIGLGVAGARIVPTSLASRLPGGVRTAADVAAVAAMAEPRRVPRVPAGAAAQAAEEVAPVAARQARFDVPTEQITAETIIPPGTSRVSPLTGQQIAELPAGQLELPLPRSRNAQEIAGLAAERRINAQAVREGALTGTHTPEDVLAAEADLSAARRADDAARQADVEDLTKRSFDQLIEDARRACRG